VTPNDFVFPPGATAPVALEASRAFHASPEWRELLPYCGALDAFIRAQPDGSRGPAPFRLGRAAAVSLSRLPPPEPSPRWTGDVVVVGECARPAELELMRRLVGGLVASGRTVLYVFVNGLEERGLAAAARAGGWGGRLTLAGIRTAEYAPGRYLRCPEAWRQREADWALLEPLLRGAGAHLGRDACVPLREMALAKVQWRRLRAGLRFGAAVVRTRYLPLSAVLLADSLGSPHRTVSLQHSVVTSPASFAPIPARRYLCFGATSRSVLAALDTDLAGRAGRDRICQELLPAGSLVDPIPEPCEPRRARTVLVVDQSSAWASRYFGGGPAQDHALLRAAEALARTCRVLDRVLVRLHPAREAAARWSALARRVGSRMELTPAGGALAEDLCRASVVVGLFSTVLPVAAAAGLPTMLLREEGGFLTPDLGGFVPRQVLAPEALVDRVEAIMGSEASYDRERQRSLAVGAGYFAGRRQCDFGPSFTERMLAPLDDSVPSSA